MNQKFLKMFSGFGKNPSGLFIRTLKYDMQKMLRTVSAVVSEFLCVSRFS